MGILIYVCIGLCVGALVAAVLVVPACMCSSQLTRMEEKKAGRLL